MPRASVSSDHSEPLQLAQAFRNFENALSPWEQTGPGVDARPDRFKMPAYVFSNAHASPAAPEGDKK